jgi:hypothetical protein
MDDCFSLAFVQHGALLSGVKGRIALGTVGALWSSGHEGMIIQRLHTR